MSLKVEDIARLAGVSKTAVSFALNNKPGISDETREKILSIVKEHGYLPKTLVKSDEELSESNTILVLSCSRTEITSGDFGTTPFFAELIKGIEKRVNELGYHLWLRSIQIDSCFQSGISTLLGNKNISGILLIATDMLAEDVEIITSQNKNVVVLDSYYDLLDIECVVMDNYQGGYTAGRYLAKLGHRDIWYIQSQNRLFNFDVRKKGFEDALKNEGLHLEAGRVLSVNPTIEAAAGSMKVALENIEKLPTAIFAENDYMAIGAIKCLQSMGINVPEDISVMGFDDIEAAAVITPELTTINVPKDKMAIHAVDRLINRLVNFDPVSMKTVMSVKLVERRSCKGL